MKKSIYTLFAFAVIATSALANQSAELDVKVPFAFKAGSSMLPAGTYKVTETSPGIVLIRGDKGSVFVSKTSILLDLDSDKASLKFRRAGDQYVLQSVNSEK